MIGHFKGIVTLFNDHFRLSTDQVLSLFISHNKKNDFFFFFSPPSKQSFPCLFRVSHTVLLSQLHFLFAHSGFSRALGGDLDSTLPSSSSLTLLPLLPLHGCSAEFLTYQTGQTASDGHSRDLMKEKGDEEKGGGDQEKQGEKANAYSVHTIKHLDN